ncbi:hypothetical protein NDU88_009465 [Pleurodeles waltl]|uniref:Uncharacterized protein n=1 Tax=Pleurodeles waltl TaxID=8319 RepID=A0AAV7S0G5_PLEWA|nr:hypothetical protein NDU88_009465 [Pleurodeles waltl]
MLRDKADNTVTQRKKKNEEIMLQLEQQLLWLEAVWAGGSRKEKYLVLEATRQEYHGLMIQTARQHHLGVQKKTACYGGQSGLTPGLFEEKRGGSVLGGGGADSGGRPNTDRYGDSTDYYCALYAPHRDWLVEGIEAFLQEVPVLDTTDLADQEAALAVEEVGAAVQAMSLGKMPGANRFKLELYKPFGSLLICTSSDCLRWHKLDKIRADSEPWAKLSLDMEKAVDTIDCRYLFGVLKRFGFSPLFFWLGDTLVSDTHSRCPGQWVDIRALPHWARHNTGVSTVRAVPGAISVLSVM